MSIGVIHDADGSSLTVSTPSAALGSTLFVAQVMIMGVNHLSGSSLSKYIPIKPAAWTNLTGGFQIVPANRTAGIEGLGWDAAAWISDGSTTSHTWTLDPAVGGAQQILTNIVGFRKAAQKVWHIEPQQGSLSGIANSVTLSNPSPPPIYLDGPYTFDTNVKTNYGNTNRGFQAEWLMCEFGLLLTQAGSSAASVLTESDTSALHFHELHHKDDSYLRMTFPWDGIPNGPGHGGVYENDYDYSLYHSYSTFLSEGFAGSTWDGSKTVISGTIQPYVALAGDTNDYQSNSFGSTTVITGRCDYNPFIFPGGPFAPAAAEGWHLFE